MKGRPEPSGPQPDSSAQVLGLLITFHWMVLWLKEKTKLRNCGLQRLKFKVMGKPPGLDAHEAATSWAVLRGSAPGAGGDDTRALLPERSRTCKCSGVTRLCGVTRWLGTWVGHSVQADGRPSGRWCWGCVSVSGTGPSPHGGALSPAVVLGRKCTGSSQCSGVVAPASPPWVDVQAAASLKVN